MNTLVAYDSSSEDDESQLQQTSNTQENAEPGTLREQDGSLPRPKIDDTPMVGPFIPSNISEGYDAYDEEHGTENLESERDMLRHLTQASHPMTEIPPSPPGSPNASSSARIKHFLDLKAKGIHFNEDLAKKSAFKNPSLLQTLMERAGLEDRAIHRTSLPSNVFDPDSLPEIGYKERLFESQQAIRAKEETTKRAQAAAGKRTIDFTSSGMSMVSNDSLSSGGLQKRSRQ